MILRGSAGDGSLRWEQGRQPLPLVVSTFMPAQAPRLPPPLQTGTRHGATSQPQPGSRITPPVTHATTTHEMGTSETTAPEV